MPRRLVGKLLGLGSWMPVCRTFRAGIDRRVCSVDAWPSASYRCGNGTARRTQLICSCIGNGSGRYRLSSA